MPPATPDPFLGVILHAIGGLAAGSFYIPFSRVRNWAWETYWLVGGVFSWIIVPWVVAWLTVPELPAVLSSAPAQALLLAYGFGVLWGIGGLTFGLSMRYLGMSLGYALALGFCAAFGTLIPPLFQQTFSKLLETMSGMTILGGVGLCLAGIGVCGKAGISKEREMSDEEKRSVIREFDFRKGVWVAIFCGIMSACMAFGITAGQPIAEAAVARGAQPLWQNNAVFVVIFAGGFTTNLLWCLYLHWKNRTGHQYVAFSSAPVLLNVSFAALAGGIWYLQFMFYGMGTTKLGKDYDFSSWTLHMAFIIIFSNMWALLFREWRGTTSRTRALIMSGIVVLIFSTIVIGAGNYLAAKVPAAKPSPEMRDAR